MNNSALVTNHSFIFTYSGFKAGFQRITGIGERANVDYIHEGGRNGLAYPIKSPGKSAGKLTFEKGYGLFNPFFDPLEGFLGFRAGMPIYLPCTIMVLNENGKISRIFAFDSGIVSSWECGALDAEKSGVLIDKLEIEHTGLYEVSCGHFNLPIP